MIESTQNLSELEIRLNHGVDQVSAVADVPISGFLNLENWRIAQDGKRIEKRNGLTVIDDDVATVLGGHDVFGYHTYYNAAAQFCQLVIAEDKIYRKTATGSWGSAIHTWASTLAHPINPLEIQGKQYVISEIENFMLLGAGTKVKVGITAPTTVPTITATYDALLLDEDMAAITDWADDDVGAGASSQATFDSKSCMRLLNTALSGNIAGRSRTVSNIGAEFTVEMSIYINTIGMYQNSNQLQFNLHNGRTNTQIIIDMNDTYVYSGKYWVSTGMNVPQDKWATYKFYINTKEPGEEYCEVYRDGRSYGQYRCSDKETTTPGSIQIRLLGESVATDVYIDYFKIGGVTGGKIVGIRRYAVTFARSGAYGSESNPIFGTVGPSVTFVTSSGGLNDMTPGGTYTGIRNKTYIVKIDGTGPPNTIKWSEDDGETWNSTTVPITTTMYLSDGVTLTFVATTGHTLDDYWTFTCSAMAADCLHQYAVLTGIPKSGETGIDQRKIYATLAGGDSYYLLAIMNDNLSTTYKDNNDDPVLGVGEDLRLDRDVAPLGKFPIYWDDRLWIFNHTECMAYYSEINDPEAFDISDRWISLRSGQSKDEITGVIPYKSHLYVFKQHAIAIIRKRTDGTYGRYWICKDYGCIAPWSLQEVGGLLMFLSHRGWEVFNGCASYSVLFSLPVRRTLATLDKTALDKVCSVVNRDYYEAWLSIPDRTSGSAITIVCNYLVPAFYFFSFAKVPSIIVEARNSSGVMKTYFGSRDGYLFTADTGVTDVGTTITATGRTPWIRFPITTQFRKMEAEIEAPTGITLTTNVYIDLQSTAVSTRTIAGSTPSAPDQEYRLPIFDSIEFFLQAKYLGFSFTESGAVGASLKINLLKFFYAAYVRRGRIAGNQ